jgi:two-component system, OmpR family, response regulator MprA
MPSLGVFCNNDCSHASLGVDPTISWEGNIDLAQPMHSNVPLTLHYKTRSQKLYDMVNRKPVSFHAEVNMATRLLLIDDDPKIISLVQRGLMYEGFEVYTSLDGESGLAAALTYRPHLVLLDIAMPGIDGFAVCRRLRLRGDIAIIMLTARDDIEDKVLALNLGADDYLPKPFVFDELLARIRAVLRRQHIGEDRLSYADLEINQTTREVFRAGQMIELTTLEYELLTLFLHHPRQVLTRAQLLTQIWGYDAETETNVLEVHIGHLRQKLEAPGSPRLIQTIRGVGYALRGATRQ